MGREGVSSTDAGDSEQGNLKLVRLHYAAFAGGDIDRIVAGLDPQVVISVHDERGLDTGELVVGRDAARGFFEGISAEVTNSTIEIEKLRADGNRVLAQIAIGGTLRKTGRSGVIPAVHLFTIHDGLITEIRTHRPDWRNYGAEEGTG